jgi:hypothetical protein
VGGCPIRHLADALPRGHILRAVSFPLHPQPALASLHPSQRPARALAGEFQPGPVAVPLQWRRALPLQAAVHQRAFPLQPQLTAVCPHADVVASLRASPSQPLTVQRPQPSVRPVTSAHVATQYWASTGPCVNLSRWR